MLTTVEGLTWHDVDACRWITLDRPQRGNSLTREMVPALTELFTSASTDDSIRAIGLTAAGDRSFCTGSDLAKSVESIKDSGTPADEDVVRGLRGGIQRLVRSMLECEKVIVLGLNGVAAGAGGALLLAADYVVAADHAALLNPFTRIGIPPDGGTSYLLTRAIGPVRAKRVLIFGERVDARTAHEWGLVSAVVPGSELAGAFRDRTLALAAGPTLALGATKRLVEHAADATIDSAFWEEAYLVDKVRGSQDAAEGYRSFAERRDPEFNGR